MSDSNTNSEELSFSCSFSSIESEELVSGEDDAMVVEPYQFEPVVSDTHSDTDDQSSDSEGESSEIERLGNTNWCQCGKCVSMPTVQECRCCSEIDSIAKKKAESESQPECIVDHEGFDAVCLNLWVLQTAYFVYRQRYGEAVEKEPHQRYRFTAYRQMVSWCWGWLGKNVRVTLPSCVINKIRERFPSETYAGFKYPNL